MCDEAVDGSLAALKLVSDWFVTSKMIKIIYPALCADENIVYFNGDSGNFVFVCIEMGILNIDLNNINLDNNFDEDDSDTVILIKLLAWHIKFEDTKNLTKISEEVIPIAWHPITWWNFCMSEGETKEIEPIFAE